MNGSQPQRVALVTSGAVRLGRAISLGLVGAGYDLVVVYRSSEEPARSLRKEALAAGRRCELMKADLTEPAASETVVEYAKGTYGRLDLLVNSAASFEPRPLLAVEAEHWDRVMSLNVRAPHLLVRAAAEMLADVKGSVINITDLSAFQPWLDYPHHAVSKAALTQLTRIQARALAPNVRVNAIAPGAVMRPAGWPDDQWQELVDKAPLGSTGSPSDVVEAALYLAGASYVTGQVLTVDGGRLLCP